VIEQVANVCHTSIARDAWERGQPLAVHGWVYGIQDGLLKDLDITVTDFAQARKVYDAALAKL
jgi:carbonic anhydrase